jgi:hypothetical protein
MEGEDDIYWLTEELRCRAQELVTALRWTVGTIGVATLKRELAGQR